jgi:gamma-glutamylputrescine oxidase
LNFALGLARAAETAGARIFEHSRATKVEPGIVSTETGRIRARFVVLACDVDMDTVAPSLGGYALPIKSYILATAPLGEERARTLIPSGAAVADTKFVLDYYRLTEDHRLLFGGGETYTPRQPPDLKRFVRAPMLRVFPQLADAGIDFAWSGRVGVTMSRLPHLGRAAPGVLFAHGFSGQGVALATLAGQLMAEAVAGTAERFDVFASLPAHRFPGGRLLRTPQMVLGMLWYALRDRL